MGLAPVLVDQIFDTITAVNEQGTTILLVEQNALAALNIAELRLRARVGPREPRGEGRPSWPRTPRCATPTSAGRSDQLDLVGRDQLDVGEVSAVPAASRVSSVRPSTSACAPM